MKAEIFNYQCWIDITSPEEISQFMDQLLIKAGFIILNRMEHHFMPQGYTAIWLLAESHLAVHTFPESGKTYVELSSCNQPKNKAFIQALKNTKLPCQVQ